MVIKESAARTLIKAGNFVRNRVNIFNMIIMLIMPSSSLVADIDLMTLICLEVCANHGRLAVPQAAANEDLY